MLNQVYSSQPKFTIQTFKTVNVHIPNRQHPITNIGLWYNDCPAVLHSKWACCHCWKHIYYIPTCSNPIKDYELFGDTLLTLPSIFSTNQIQLLTINADSKSGFANMLRQLLSHRKFEPQDILAPSGKQQRIRIFWFQEPLGILGMFTTLIFSQRQIEQMHNERRIYVHVQLYQFLFLSLHTFPCSFHWSMLLACMYMSKLG